MSGGLSLMEMVEAEILKTIDTMLIVAVRSMFLPNIGINSANRIGLLTLLMLILRYPLRHLIWLRSVMKNLKSC